MTVSVTETCPDCGTALVAEPGLGGLCPKCLLELAIAAEYSDQVPDFDGSGGMVVKAGTDRCPECGLELPGESWSTGLCPRCLFELAVEESPAEAPTLVAPSGLSSESPTALYSESRVGGEESLNPGQLLGDRYRIESLLGRGGMGKVWRAYDLKLRLEVALKSLHPKLFETEDALELLRDEVRAAREVTSPNVCRLYDLVEVSDRELVSMEFVDGVTLHDHLKQCGPLVLREANEIASQLLAGLEAVHDAGLVHRDIKPENVMLTRTGRVVVMDFGLTSPSGSGSIGGTPAYMPPEQASGEATDARADVYSAGIVLAEMLSAERGPEESSRQTFWERIREEPPELPDSPWKPILTRAVSPAASERYATSAELARALEEVAYRVEGVKHEHPYPGLASFQEDDAEFFFGREAEVEAMWKKLQQSPLLGLIGPSGSGKSSFLNAGLLPASPEGWVCVRMTPGSDPFAALGRALLPELETDREAMGFLSSLEGPEPALEVLRRQRARHGELLVVVDQLEELFTQSDVEEQHRFADLLGRAALEADVHVLLSMRDDYLFHCQAFEALKPLFSELTPLGPPTGSSLRRAIIQPALRCGYRFEDETIVEEMLQEVTKERAALPLIAFTASQLWERRDRETGYLTREAYDVVGGVGGALAQHAESTLEQVGQDSIPIVRELFRNLVTAQGTRASRDRDELLSVFAEKGGQASLFGDCDDTFKTSGKRVPVPLLSTAAEVLNALIDSRLLTSYEIPERENRPGHQRVEIVHESLLTAWPRLVRWQMQDAEGAQLRDDLRQAAQRWDQHDRSDDLLWTGTAFQEFQIWRERYPGRLSTQEEAFAAAMKTHAERRQRRRRIAAVTVIGLLLVVLAVIGGFWRRSVAEARRAEAASLYSVAQARLEEHPTGALAYATSSLERADSPATRRLVLKALWKGPTEIRLPEGSWISLDFSPDGRWLATSNLQKGCRIWPSNGGPPVVLEGCDSPMEGLFSPTGQSIAYALNGDGDRQEMKVWSFPEGRLRRSLDLGGFATYFYRFSPDGSRLITSTDHLVGQRYEVEIRSWPVEGGLPERIARLEMPRESIGAFVGVDPTLSRLLWSDSTRLRLAAISSGGPDMTRVGTIEQEDLISMTAFDPGNRRIATLDALGVPSVWSVGSYPPTLEGRLPPAIRGIIPSGVAFRFNEAGSMLAHAEGYLWRLDAPPSAGLHRLRRFSGAVKGEESESGFGLAFHPSGHWMATGHAQSVSLWPLARRYPFVLEGHEGWVKNVRFAPDGEWLVSTAGDNSVRIWPLRRREGEGPEVVHQVVGAYPPSRIKVAPNGKFLALATYTGRVLILPKDGGEVRTLTGFTDVVKTVAIGPQSRLVAAGAGVAIPDQAIVRIWDLVTGETRILDDGTRERLHRVEFEDQRTLIVATVAGTLKRWNLGGVTPQLVDEFEVPGPAVDIRPDLGQVLALEDDTGPLWIYDLDERALRELGSHGSAVFSASFSPDGQAVASVDKQGTVRIGPVSGGEPHLLLGHEGEINHVTFSPDGRWIATSGDDKLIFLWPTPDLSQPPLHKWPLEDLLAKLSTLTNLRAVEDPDSPTGWKLEVGPFPGWEEVPTW